MKVLLLQDVPKTGQKGDIVEVRDGYAQNFLFPHRLAKPISHGEAERLLLEKNKQTEKRGKEQEELKKQIRTLEGETVVVSASASETGHLFAAVHEPEIVAAIKNIHGLELSENVVEVTKPIKEIGSHTVHLKSGETTVPLVVVIEREP